MTQQNRLARTFVELTNTLMADFDVVDFLHTLARCSAELFDVAETGVMLADQRGGLRVIASSSERARLLELFEIQNEDGPSLDCFRTGLRVSVMDLGQESDRWTMFTTEAVSAGVRSVDALALRCEGQVIGVLNFFRTSPGALTGDDLVSAEALADVATMGVLHQRAAQEARVLVEQLQAALNSRIVIEQAKGMLAERAKTSLDAAFAMLRGHARNHNVRLSEVAEMLIASRLGVDDLRVHSLE